MADNDGITHTSTYRIQSDWLWLARGIWILLARMAVVIFIAGNSGLYTVWRQPLGRWIFEQGSQREYKE